MKPVYDAEFHGKISSEQSKKLANVYSSKINDIAPVEATSEATRFVVEKYGSEAYRESERAYAKGEAAVIGFLLAAGIADILITSK